MITDDVAEDINKILQTQIVKMSGKDSESSDSILDRLSAYEKLLRHAMARFSKERLYDMLQTVHEEIKNNVRYPRSARTAAEAKKPTTAPLIKIRSIAQVRSTVRNIEKRGESNLTDKERRAIKYFDVFEKDVAYLTDLKKYFGENIHSVLQKEYFDPKDRVKKPSTARSDAGSDTSRGSLSSRSSTKSVKPMTKKNSQKDTTDEFQFEKLRLSELLTDMDDLNSKWSGLLADRDINLEDFDPDSHYELAQFTNYADYEAILRLVPDVFVKCYKAVDIARDWWKLANTIYSGRLPLKSKRVSTPAKTPPMRTPIPKTPSPSPTPSPKPEEIVETYVHTAKELKHNITEISEYIRDSESKLENLGDEMKALENRDGRIEYLTNDFEQMDSKLQTAQKEYSNFLMDRKRTIEQINKLPEGSRQYHDLTKRANNMDYEMQKRQNELRLLEFEKTVMQEDYLLELELRPSFIHYLGDVKQQIDDIKEEISQKQTEKTQLEKQLALLKTNTDKMKIEMQKYLNTSEQNQISRQLSILTKEIEEDLLTLHELESEKSFVSLSDDVDLDEYLSGVKPEDLSPVKGQPETHNGHYSRLEQEGRKSGAQSSSSVKG